MIIEDSNLQSIKINDNNEPCIFCLSNEPTPITYVGSCKCHPSIHDLCISEWYKTKPNTCPICLNQNSSNANLIIVAEPTITRNIVFVICCSCCFGIFCSPFMIIGLIFALHHTNVSHQTIINATISP